MKLIMLNLPAPRETVHPHRLTAYGSISRICSFDSPGVLVSEPFSLCFELLRHPGGTLGMRSHLGQHIAHGALEFRALAKFIRDLAERQRLGYALAWNLGHRNHYIEKGVHRGRPKKHGGPDFHFFFSLRLSDTRELSLWMEDEELAENIDHMVLLADHLDHLAVLESCPSFDFMAQPLDLGFAKLAR